MRKVEEMDCEWLANILLPPLLSTQLFNALWKTRTMLCVFEEKCLCFAFYVCHLNARISLILNSMRHCLNINVASIPLYYYTSNWNGMWKKIAKSEKLSTTRFLNWTQEWVSHSTFSSFISLLLRLIVTEIITINQPSISCWHSFLFLSSIAFFQKIFSFLSISPALLHIDDN